MTMNVDKLMDVFRKTMEENKNTVRIHFTRPDYDKYLDIYIYSGNNRVNVIQKLMQYLNHSWTINGCTFHV